MRHAPLSVHSRLLVLFLSLLFAGVAHAVDRTWDGSSSTNFNNLFNWTPSGVPQDGDTATIAGGPNSALITLTANSNAIDGLTVSNNSTLSTDGHQLIVDDVLVAGPITLPNRSSTLVDSGGMILVRSGATGSGGTAIADFNPDNLTIGDAGAVSLLPTLGSSVPVMLRGDGGIVIEQGGLLSGESGEVNLNGLLNNNGTIRAVGDELTIEARSGSAAISADLDGGSEGGVLDIQPDAWLTINTPLADSFDGIVNVGTNGRLVFGVATRIGSSNFVLSDFSEVRSLGPLVIGRSDSGSPAEIRISREDSLLRVGDIALSSMEGAAYLSISGGSPGAARMTIQEGAKVVVRNDEDLMTPFGAVVALGGSDGGTGELNVTGSGSELLTTFVRVVNGTLRVNDSASVVSSPGGAAILGTVGVPIGGPPTATSGQVVVEDLGTVWDTGGSLLIAVGQNATGVVDILSGGRVRSSRSRIGSELGAHGAVNVRGQGSTWELRAGIDLANTTSASGQPGSATLNISDGGLVQIRNLSVLEDNVSIGDPDSAYVSAEVHVSNGGVLDVSGEVNVFKDTVGSGTSTLNLDSGTVVADRVVNRDTLISAGASTILANLLVLSSGSTTSVSDTLAVDADGVIATDAAFTGGGTWRAMPGHQTALDDEADLSNVVLQNEGRLKFSLAPETVAKASAGAYKQTADGTLEIDVTASFSGGADALFLKRDIDLAGTLDISLIGGFEPVLGQSFRILNSVIGTVDGTFDAVLAPIFDEKTFAVVYNASSVEIQVVRALPGDYNDDGIVDAADYTVWRDNLGASVILPGDTTPGSVTAADYDVWRAYYGATTVAGLRELAGISVPEPGAYTLLALAVSVLVTRRSKRRRLARSQDRITFG